MFVRIIAIDFVAATLIVTGWYFWFLRINRRKAVQVISWIEHAFDGHGQIAGVEWQGLSSFQVRLRIWPNLFRQTRVAIYLHPRHLLFSWLAALVAKRHETLTFSADLDIPPSFNLEVHNHRWCGRTRRRFPSNTENWTLQRSRPFVITTRNDWQRDITNMMNALFASRECDCVTVSFSRTSPHFSATVPLESIDPKAHSQGNVFDVMRELAAVASASRF